MQNHSFSEVRVWLDGYEYAKRLLLRSTEDPWESAAKFAAFFGQAHNLLKPDVAVIDARAMYSAWLERHPDIRATLVSKRGPVQAVRRLLERPEPRALLLEVIGATLSQLRGRAPLVVSMPSPRHWLHYANSAAGVASVQPDADSIEDAAMFLADLTRSISEMPIAGLMLEERDDPATSLADLQHYRPVINVAKHYRWSLTLRTAGGAPASDVPADDVAVLIAPTRPPPHAGILWGVDVSGLLWAGKALPGLEQGQFYFAAIPPSERPEHVLDCVARLRDVEVALT